LRFLSNAGHGWVRLRPEIEPGIGSISLGFLKELLVSRRTRQILMLRRGSA
jgi:hypothetical protein